MAEEYLVQDPLQMLFSGCSSDYLTLKKRANSSHELEVLEASWICAFSRVWGTETMESCRGIWTKLVIKKTRVPTLGVMPISIHHQEILQGVSFQSVFGEAMVTRGSQWTTEWTNPINNQIVVFITLYYASFKRINSWISPWKGKNCVELVSLEQQKSGHF